MFDWQHIFGDIGKLVRGANLAHVAAAAISANMPELEGQLDDDEADLVFLATALSGTDGAATRTTATGATLGRLVKTYTVNRLPEKIASAHSQFDEILTDLLAKMVDEAQTVDANHPTVTPPYTEAGDNNNQLSDWDDIRGMSSANAELVARDWVMYVSIIDDGAGFYHVELFNDSAKGGGDLIAHTATYNTTGSKTLLEDNASDITGSITVDAVTAADADITVTYDFDGTAMAGNGWVSAWDSSQMAVDDDLRITCSSIPAVGSETWAVVSRLRGTGASATTGVAYPGDSTDTLGVEFTITAGAGAFVVGDEFVLSTGVTDSGVFQSFYRDQFGVALPSDDEGAETIDDALAV